MKTEVIGLQIIYLLLYRKMILKIGIKLLVIMKNKMLKRLFNGIYPCLFSFAKIILKVLAGKM